MNIHHLFNHSIRYRILRKYTVFVHSLFYEEICIINKENVPEGEPVIFAPNHQNALMDALAIICTYKKQPVFMARADIFKKKLVSSILFFLKIIPVYRIRDGVDNLANNDKSFQLALQVLQHKKSMGIMPEGNHGNQRRLRPLKKGLVRFALQAQEDFGPGQSLKIIPVGLDYSHYSNFRSKLLIIYGTPISVSEFSGEFKANPQKAMNLLRERLAESMKSYMINVDNDTYYDLIIQLGELYLERLKKKLEAHDNFYDRFQVMKIITDKLTSHATEKPQDFENLRLPMHDFSTSTHHLGLNREVLELKIPNLKTLSFDIFRYAIFLPVAIVCTLFHGIPAAFIKFISDRIKDTQFQSSFKFVLSMFLFPLYYLVMLFLPLPMYTKILFLVFMPMLGILSFDYFTGLNKLWKTIRYYHLYHSQNPELNRLIQLRKQILIILDTLI